MKKFIFSLFVVGMAATFLCTTSSARVKTVYGNVSDKSNNDPIENAAIHPDGMTVYAVTDSRGLYEISFNTNSSDVKLIAEAEGYNMEKKSADGEICNFSLKSNASGKGMPGYVLDIVHLFVALIN